MKLKLIKRKTINGFGFIIKKGYDENEEEFNSYILVFKNKKILMISYCKDGWYSDLPQNIVKFKKIHNTLFLKKLAITKIDE